MNPSALDETTRRLARYAHGFEVRTLDARSLHECRRRLVDAAACAVAAFDEPFCQHMQAFAGRYTGPQMARVWGRGGQRSSMEMAAFANGTTLRYQDWSDTFMSTNAGHPSDMIGALVAAAEAQRCDGAALVGALVVAYELYGGLCDAVALRDKGIDQATCAAVGAAAGVGRLMGLGENGLGQAIALALAPNLHLYNVRKGMLSDWKGSAGPNGARNGAFAALLAAEGVGGPTAVIEGAGGLFDVVGPFDWQVGERAAPRIVDTHLKLHPVCYHGQCAMDAVLALRARAPVDEIAAIEVETYDAAYDMMGGSPERWAPATRETADHSLPYTIAVALREGRITPADYAEDRLRDPAVARVMEKVTVRRSPEFTREFPRRLPTRVTVRLRDGSALGHLQEYPRGHALNPLADAELASKFTGAWAGWRGDADAPRALDLFWNADQVRDVGVLVDALCMQ